MDATEYALILMIVQLENRVANLDKEAVKKDELDEKIRLVLLNNGLIEPSAGEEG